VISTKVAFIYDALYGYTDDYSKILLDKVQHLSNPKKGWYGGLYSRKFRKNRSLDASTNMAVLASYYYKKVGNFYYYKQEELKDKIALHHFQGKNLYTLESKDDAFFYKIEDRFKDFDDNVSDIIRIVRKGDNFVMHYAVFENLLDAQNYLKSHRYQFRDFNITATPVVDDKDFLLSNRYYRYDYRLPYENKMIDEENKAFKTHYKVYKEAFKKEHKQNAKDRAIEKEKAYKKKRKEEKKRKKEEKAEEKAEKKAKAKALKEEKKSKKKIT
jgi:hypothetical protein